MYDATGFYSHLWLGLFRCCCCCYCYLHFVMEEIYHGKVVPQLAAKAALEMKMGVA